MKISRRRFLKAAGLAAAGGALGLGSALAWIQPRKHLLAPEGNERRPERIGKPSRVVVVGGGLAGISAATELAARGFQVTLLERAGQVGGKLGGWPVQALGRSFPMEHGFHGFFPQYYNFNELLALAGVGEDLKAAPDYPILFHSQPEERFGAGTSLFPLNLVSVIARSPSMHWSEFREDGPGLEWLMKYRPDETWARFDGESFAAFMERERIHPGMRKTVLEPFGKALLNGLDKLSAAEAIRFFHFYFMGNPEGLGFRLLRRDSMTAVLGPMRARLESLGGVVRTSLGARRVVAEGERVVGVAVDSAATPIPRTPVALADVPAHGYREVHVDGGDGGAFFVGRRDGAIVALDGRCTHMGCPVRWEDAAGEFHCPCHNGRYDGSGVPIDGPPKRPLARLPVIAATEKDGESVYVGGAALPSEEVIPCDYLVLACDTRGLQQLVQGSPLPPLASSLRSQLAAQGTADPYSVVRFWLDAPARPDRAPFYTASGFVLTDSIAFYSQFQEPFVSWARATGGSVVECHAYGIPAALQASVSRYRDVFLEELRGAVPELRDARVLHEEAMAQDNFTRYAPGDHATRPGTKTPVPNLFLAGDHVALPLPAFLMEGAVMSGRFAANAILAAEGLREVPIPYVAPKGPLA